eukprot:Opistho-2@18598
MFGTESNALHWHPRWFLVLEKLFDEHNVGHRNDTESQKHALDCVHSVRRQLCTQVVLDRADGRCKNACDGNGRVWNGRTVCAGDRPRSTTLGCVAQQRRQSPHVIERVPHCKVDCKPADGIAHNKHRRQSRKVKHGGDELGGPAQEHAQHDKLLHDESDGSCTERCRIEAVGPLRSAFGFESRHAGEDEEGLCRIRAHSESQDGHSPRHKRKCAVHARGHVNQGLLEVALPKVIDGCGEEEKCGDEGNDLPHEGEKGHHAQVHHVECNGYANVASNQSVRRDQRSADLVIECAMRNADNHDESDEHSKSPRVADDQRHDSCTEGSSPLRRSRAKCT